MLIASKKKTKKDFPRVKDAGDVKMIKWHIMMVFIVQCAGNVLVIWCRMGIGPIVRNVQVSKFLQKMVKGAGNVQVSKFLQKMVKGAGNVQVVMFLLKIKEHAGNVLEVIFLQKMVEHAGNVQQVMFLLAMGKHAGNVQIIRLQIQNGHPNVNHVQAVIFLQVIV